MQNEYFSSSNNTYISYIFVSKKGGETMTDRSAKNLQ